MISYGLLNVRARYLTGVTYLMYNIKSTISYGLPYLMYKYDILRGLILLFVCVRAEFWRVSLFYMESHTFYTVGRKMDQQCVSFTTRSQGYSDWRHHVRQGKELWISIFDSNVNGFYHCCGWDIDGRQKCPQKIENREEILSFEGLDVLFWWFKSRLLL